ncbi:hypothetical protein M569_09662 [Genlisea aurea]|uniref:Auxin-binding protein 1 n=1 Tax=Genlisea aurea TaxID=192259 RepID=S8DPU2_9LAMI|nr:hypothetical protein M569_09662 [Genlisea aurea]
MNWKSGIVMEEFLWISSLMAVSLVCWWTDSSRLDLVRNISEIEGGDYGRPGLSHVTVASSLRDGFDEVEVWLQTFGPGTRTPIHRHACEEVFVVLKGGGTLYLAAASSSDDRPGTPVGFPIGSNTTFRIPVNDVHQVWNTDEEQDLQFVVVISRPPVKVYTYQDWNTKHAEAKLMFPYHWDRNFFTP